MYERDRERARPRESDTYIQRGGAHEHFKNSPRLIQAGARVRVGYLR